MTRVYFSGTGFVYQFPPSSEIAAKSTIILAGNSDVFIKKYGVHPYGQFTRNLSNKSEKLVLADGFGNVIDSVTYSDQPPWPDADGNGYYLELIVSVRQQYCHKLDCLNQYNRICVGGNGERPYIAAYIQTPVRDNLYN